MGFAREGALKRQFGFIFVSLALLGVVYGENLKLRALDAAWVAPPQEDPVRWNPVLARVFSFGQIPAVVDWMWLRLLQDVDLWHVKAGKHPSIYYDLILATDLDPADYDVYTVGADILSIIRDDNTGALELTRRAQDFARTELPTYSSKFAERYWNPLWVIPMTRAYLELFEFNNLPRSAEAFKEASELPGSPAYLKHLVTRLSTRAGQFEVGASLLQFKLESATAKSGNDAVRESLEKKIRDFQISRLLFQVNERFDSFLAKQRRSERDRFRAFPRFLAETSESDPGLYDKQLKLDAKGRIISTIPHDDVLGMEMVNSASSSK